MAARVCYVCHEEQSKFKRCLSWDKIGSTNCKDCKQYAHKSCLLKLQSNNFNVVECNVCHSTNIDPPIVVLREQQKEQCVVGMCYLAIIMAIYVFGGYGIKAFLFNDTDGEVWSLNHLLSGAIAAFLAICFSAIACGDTTFPSSQAGRVYPVNVESGSA